MRDNTTRMFGAPASVEKREDAICKFEIKMKNYQVTEVNKLEELAPEVKLVRFAHTDYAKELAKKNECKEFISYCAEKIYNQTIAELLNDYKKISMENEPEPRGADWWVDVEGLVLAGAVVVVDIVGVGMNDDPEARSAESIIGAASLCGGKAFKENVAAEFSNILQNECQTMR